MIYALSASDFRDITSGTSTGSPHISATAGYDRVTGRGSPIANKVVADLAGGTVVTPPATVAGLSVNAPSSAVAGTSFSVVVTAVDSTGAAFPSFTGTVSFSSSDILAGLPSSYTFTSADRGTHTFTFVLKTAGTDSVLATSGTLSGSDSVAVTPAAASKLAFSQQPASTTAGSIASASSRFASSMTYGNFETKRRQATKDRPCRCRPARSPARRRRPSAAAPRRSPTCRSPPPAPTR